MLKSELGREPTDAEVKEAVAGEAATEEGTGTPVEDGNPFAEGEG
jgi:hypothetical protein